MNDFSKKAAIQKDYQHYAPVYEEKWAHFLSPPRQWILKDLQKEHTPDKRTAVCDLGCGTAALLSQVYKLYPESLILGADLSRDMLKQAKLTLPDGKFVAFDFDQMSWPLDETKYNVIFSLFLLHHLKDAAKFLSHVKNLMNEETSFYFADFVIEGWRMKVAEIYWRLCKPSHQKAFSKTELTKLITNAGFQIEKQKIFKPDHFWRLQIYKLTLKGL